MAESRNFWIYGAVIAVVLILTVFVIVGTNQQFFGQSPDKTIYQKPGIKPLENKIPSKNAVMPPTKDTTLSESEKDAVETNDRITDDKTQTIPVLPITGPLINQAASPPAPDTLLSNTLTQFPGYTNLPTDPDSDGIYEDTNGNGRIDFGDVSLYYYNIQWISENQPVQLFDLDNDRTISKNDVILVFSEVPKTDTSNP